MDCEIVQKIRSNFASHDFFFPLSLLKYIDPVGLFLVKCLHVLIEEEGIVITQKYKNTYKYIFAILCLVFASGDGSWNATTPNGEGFAGRSRFATQQHAFLSIFWLSTVIHASTIPRLSFTKLRAGLLFK